VTALGKLVRTTAFKLMAVYLLVFTLFAAFLLGYFFWNAQRLLGLQINSTIDTEITSLAEQYGQGGLLRLIATIERRSRRPGSLLYLVVTPQGDALTGNVSELPSESLERSGWNEVPYARSEATPGESRTALVRVFALSGGYRLLVGLDLEEQRRVRSIMTTAALWSAALIVVLGVAGGWFVTRRVLHRLDDINETSRSIIEGDLGRRLKVAGTEDEIDRLASTTNAMLDRIQELMTGLKEVSDNIAHDLKTPLTRLRNRAEEALRQSPTEQDSRLAHDYRLALEKTIEESDGLIRTFNALLMIARAEAGQLETAMSEFDAAEVARGVADLYEPVAEEAGIALKVDAMEPLIIRGNRELIGQAVANLVDNAIKHGTPSAEGATPQSATPEGATPRTIIPEVEIGARLVGGHVAITIADRGEGVPERDRGRVLERFVRLEGSRTRPGSGLGLSLAAAVAKLHGGGLRLEDNGPGLRAVIELPNRPAAT
jgi:signal transduction histidine kinase